MTVWKSRNRAGGWFLRDCQCAKLNLKDAKQELCYQFERLAYFVLDKDS
jgi:hypothetical protein